MRYSRRGRAFSVDEDKLLVICYLGAYQKEEKNIWSRVSQTYHEHLSRGTESRTIRALQSRWSTISKNVQKFSESVRKVELRHPCGALEQDILNEAKEHFKELGFTWKFDHLWPLLQNQDKFRSSATNFPIFRERCRNLNMSRSHDSSIKEAPTPASQGLSEFDLNSDEDSSSMSSKSKRKADAEISEALSVLANGNEKLATMMQEMETHRQIMETRSLELMKGRNALKVYKEENKVLLKDPMSVDESVRPYLINEQHKIIAKRNSEQERLGQE